MKTQKILRIILSMDYFLSKNTLKMYMIFLFRNLEAKSRQLILWIFYRILFNPMQIIYNLLLIKSSNLMNRSMMSINVLSNKPYKHSLKIRMLLFIILEPEEEVFSLMFSKQLKKLKGKFLFMQ